MFRTGIRATITGRTTREALLQYTPDGKEVTNIRLVCGDGTVKYPSMYVEVPVWESLAIEAQEVLNRKGINVEANGWLQWREYPDKRGSKQVAYELKDVREIRVYDRDGALERILISEK